MEVRSNEFFRLWSLKLPKSSDLQNGTDSFITDFSFLLQKNKKRNRKKYSIGVSQIEHMYCSV